MWTVRTYFWFLLLTASVLVAEVPSETDQIASSVLACPEEWRTETTVLGYDSHGKIIVLRKGSNDLTCLADTPGNEGFSVACYHNDLEQFMARGRELSAQGYKGKERHEIRWREVDNGSVAMPREPRMLYVLSGKGFDSTSGSVIEPYLRWVVYTPYATPESTGLSAAPGKGPWLMFPGTAGAHIMISPPKR